MIFLRATLKISSLFIALFTLMPNAGAEDVNTRRFKTNKLAKHGNWLASISIGQGVAKDATLALRDTIEEMFVSSQGGLYTQAIDISDFNTEEITIELLDRQMDRLAKKIHRFKTKNPNTPQRLMISLTGHGSWDQDEKAYSFSINENESLSGRHLVHVLSRFEVAEIIVIVQSCQSGSLATKNMQKFVDSLNDDIHKSNSKTRFAVITPVNRYIYSPLNTWEDILRKSFSKATDRNHDKVVTFAEWKRAILETARSYPEYVSKKLIEANPDVFANMMVNGLDPQFYEHNFPAKAPMFLTKKGARLFSIGELDWSPIRRHVSFNKANLLEQQSIQAGQTLIDKILSLLEEGNDEKFEKFVKKTGARKDLEGRRLSHLLEAMGLFRVWKTKPTKATKSCTDAI